MKSVCMSFVALCAAAVPMAASAETLTVEGVYGSRVAIPGNIEVIATEAFGGGIGPDVALDLSDALSSVYIEGEPYFRIIPAATAGASQVVIIDRSDGNSERYDIDNPNAPDAVLRGSVRLVDSDRRVKDRVTKECVTVDDDGKCTQREEIRTRCDEFKLRLVPRIQLVAPDGAQLYSVNNERSESVRYCADEDVEIDPEAMAEKMVRELISDIRLDIAPSERRESIRIMERRRGLEGADRSTFRDTVKLTNTDPNAACDGFEALEKTNPTHSSVLYNVGLCYEAAGNLVLAEDYYNRALESDPGRDYPTWGLERIRSRQLGETQMEARSGA